MVVLILSGLIYLSVVGGDDYCQVDDSRCDEYGVYKYLDFTSYEDFLIRDRLDDDIEVTFTRPVFALKKANKTLKSYSKWIHH